MSNTVESFKTAGNQAFSEGRYPAAIQSFTDAIKAMEEESKDQKKADATYIHPQAAALYSNRSACYCKIDKHLEALHDADRCLNAKPDWWKGHCRKAYALEGLDRYEDCAQSLKKCLELEPSNEEIFTKLKHINAVIAKQGRDKASGKTSATGGATNKGTPTRMLPPAIHGKWLDIANKNNTQALPTPNCRKGKKLAVRPSILSVAPTQPNRPMFFPAAPKWPLDTEHFATHFVDNVTDTNGRAPPRQETRFLLNISANAYNNQKKADDAYRQQNKIEPECAYCGILMTFKDPSHCECGEPFCSRQCLELGYDDHKKVCETIRSQSQSLPMFHRIYWDGCRYGMIDWIGTRVKNYSRQYYSLKKKKGGAAANTHVAPTLGPNGMPTPKRDVNMKADENDIEDLDEFTYLMMHERTAMMNKLTELQDAVKLAVASGEQKRTNETTEDLCGALLEFYLLMSNYDEHEDTPFRCQFKLMMAEMLMGALKQFNLVQYVESLDMVMMRFAEIFKGAGQNELVNAQQIVDAARQKMNKA